MGFILFNFFLATFISVFIGAITGWVNGFFLFLAIFFSYVQGVLSAEYLKELSDMYDYLKKKSREWKNG